MSRPSGKAQTRGQELRLQKQPRNTRTQGERPKDRPQLPSASGEFRTKAAPADIAGDEALWGCDLAIEHQLRLVHPFGVASIDDGQLPGCTRSDVREDAERFPAMLRHGVVPSPSQRGAQSLETLNGTWRAAKPAPRLATNQQAASSSGANRVRL